MIYYKQVKVYIKKTVLYQGELMKKKRIMYTLIAVLLTAAVFILPIINSGYDNTGRISSDPGRSSFIISDGKDKQNSGSEISIPQSDETVTFIVIAEGDPLADTVAKSEGKYSNISELLLSSESRSYNDSLKKNQAVVRAGIRKIVKDVSFDGCFSYTALLNGFSVRAPYSALSKLSSINGVRGVYLVSMQNAAISETETDTTAHIQISDEISLDDAFRLTSDEIGADKAYKTGATGKGKLIAVIDDSFNCQHQAFTSVPPEGRYNAQTVSALVSAAQFNTAEKSTLYKNDKIIFAYDYAGRDDGTLSVSSHGTHTASAAAGNDPAQKTTGIAPDSQLALFKVCSDGSSTASDDVILAALDDCAKLSPDVLNISMGVPRMSSNQELFSAVLERLYNMGTFICSSAGNNSTNLFDTNNYGISPEYTDYGTASFPSVLPFVISAGSCNSKSMVSKYLTFNEDTVIKYEPIVNESGESVSLPEGGLSGEYITISTEDNQETDITGKIIVIKSSKDEVIATIKAASDSGAAGVIILSDTKPDETITVEGLTIPAVCIYRDDISYFDENPAGTLLYNEKTKVFVSENGGAPSDFSSYGPTSDLRLKPDLLAPGTNIVSGDISGISGFSGTSASSALVSGAAAVADSFLDEKNISDGSNKLLLRSLMSGTAKPLKNENGLWNSPRLQGAGCLSLEGITNASAYVFAANGSVNISFGDSEDGSFLSEITLKSLSDSETKYTLSADVQTDRLIGSDDGIINTLSPESLSSECNISYILNGEPISEVTLLPGEEKTIQVSLKLSPAAVLALEQMAPSGAYVEGFVFMTPSDNSTQLHIPFIGYCGSWEMAEMFDSTVYDDNSPAVSEGCLRAAASSTGAMRSCELGKSIANGEYDNNRICIGKDTIKNYFDESSAGSAFVIPDLFLLRDAANYTITVDDLFGNSLLTVNTGNISAFASASYRPYEMLLSSFNSDSLKNVFSSLSEGTYIYTVTASTISDENTVSYPQSLSFTIHIDNTVPTVDDAELFVQDGRLYLRLSGYDENGVSGFVLYTSTETNGGYHYADRIDNLIEDGYLSEESYKLISAEKDNGWLTCTYDITELNSQLTRLRAFSSSTGERNSPQRIFFSAADYAFNLSSPKIARTETACKAEYLITDEKSRPIAGTILGINDKRAITNENGIAAFDDITPGLYAARLISLPEGCKSDFTVDLFTLSNEQTEHIVSLIVDADEEYFSAAAEKESSDNFGKNDDHKRETVHEKLESERNPINTETEYNDNGIPGLLFVSVLLLIFSVSFIISRKRRRGADLDENGS